ncbi:MAG: serine/threonine protein kinase [Myxococcales bacterium]|nr:serine/threonine protein kinase [Myxococcales bacterium]MCB9717075.1 serine/threonine protein kinase [Myxococcales bacterium]
MSDEPSPSSVTIDVPGRPDNAARRDRMRAALFGEEPRARTLGRFEIRGELGRGGMGVVLEAFDPELDRPVALKLLHPRLDDAAQADLLREARLLAKVAHPHVVHVYEAGRIDGRVLIAMELVRGQTLRQWQRAAPRGCAEILDAYRQAGQGLAAAHAAGVVHRDFKPHNCIRDEAGHVRVLDFGLADHPSAGDGTSGGTRAYMAPEQLEGEACDARSDQFSFCVALHEALHGVHPLAQDERRGLGEALPSEGTGVRVPRWIDRALERGLAEDPRWRWPDMDALLHALRPRRRARWVVAALALGVGVGAAGVGLVASGDEPVEPCGGAELRVSESWNDARRDAVRRALLDTGLPMASETWPRVRDELDAHLERWAQTHTEVCRATRVRGEQSVERLDLRMACLEQRLDAVDGLLDVLEHADAEVVIAAIDAVHELPRAEPCRRLEPRASPEPPEAAVLRRELGRALAERDAGRPERALEQLEALRERAVASGTRWLAAELLVRRGEVLEELGRGADADRPLDQGLWAALEVGHDEAAFEAAVAHAGVVGLLLIEEERGLVLVDHARALLGRIGAPDDARQELELVAGLVLGRHGRYEEAMQSLDRAEAGVEPGGREHLDVLAARGNVGLWCDRLDDARSQLERHLEIASGVYGPRHPEVANTLNDLAVLEIQQGRAKAAEARARAAVEILQESVGDHPRVADALMNLAGILMIREEPDLEGALRRIEDARRIYVEALGEGSAKVADADLALAMGLESLGRLEQAEQAYRRNLELQRRLKGERHPDLRHPLLALGTLLLDTGRPAEAIEPIEQAVALARELARSAGEGADPSGFIRDGERLLAQARAEAEP